MKPISPPTNCKWWTLGDSTHNPPEDEEFLRNLASAGFATFIASGGLVGAVTEKRYVDVIHRGRGRIWRVGFVEDDKECHFATVTMLPRRSAAVIAWLNCDSLEAVQRILQE